ncbi:MAG TPA: ATP-binding protein [Gaiellaceae bacterium]|nr:ATP-binding protein [Gaiellaceae bacterium]
MRRLRRSLTAKLLAAQLLVIIAGSVTLVLVALALAPSLFQAHVRDALGIVPEDVSRHLDEAFEDSVLISLAIAIGAAALTAAVASGFLAVRIVRPIRALSEASQRIARGAYGSRVPTGGSDELAVLASSFNEMAASLETAERRRRALLSDVAHELRTPLATIEGYVEGLRDSVVEPDEQAWMLLATETGRLRRLVDDLQLVSRAEERQLDLRAVEVDPASLVEEAVQGAGPAYEAKGVQLEARAELRLPAVAVDPHRIGEVLANLLENALRHTPEGGRVDVRAERRGGAVELSVSDTGEGIAPEHLERVFERFFRSDPARSRATGGSGIGLTIARAIAEAHGGRLRAESDGPGHGARFILSLPPAR